MASSNIKIFDENKTNMMSDNNYESNDQRLDGVQSGVASSLLHNKTLYQVSLVAYAIAQLMQANGFDANDSEEVTTFVGDLSNSILQKVADKATEEEAEAGTNNTKWLTPATAKKVPIESAASAENVTGTVAILNGGTGATTAANARTNLGLGNVGNFKAVSTVASQGLSDTEKSNARTNIGAGTSSFSGSYNDLSNKPTIPQGTVTSVAVKMNNTVKGTVTSSGTIDLGTVITSHQSLSSYATTSSVTGKLNRTDNVNAANTSYTTYMARGEALFSSDTNPTANGTIAWTYA